MKYIKLFEAYNRRNKFSLPPLFNKPKNLSADRMYLVDISTGDGDAVTFLADSQLVDQIYDVMNLRVIESAIAGYSGFLKQDGSKEFDPMKSYFPEEVKMLVSSPKFGPPIDVLFVSANDSEIKKSIKSMTKPEEDISKRDSSVYFDKNRESDITDVVFNSETDSEDYTMWMDDNSGDPYYVEFPKICTCLVSSHPANEVTISEISGGSIIADAYDILYRYIINSSSTFVNGKLDFKPSYEYDMPEENVIDIMSVLVDDGVSLRVIDWVKKKFPYVIEQQDESGVEYARFKVSSQIAEKYYVQEWLYDAERKHYGYGYGVTREDFIARLEKTVERQRDIVTTSDWFIKIPLSIVDDVMKKLPRTEEEMEKMIDASSREELIRGAEEMLLIIPDSSHLVGTKEPKVEAEKMVQQVRTGFRFPASDPIKTKGTAKFPDDIKKITPEMIKKLTPFGVYCLVFHVLRRF
jgi:hypothetical protein